MTTNLWLISENLKTFKSHSQFITNMFSNKNRSFLLKSKLLKLPLESRKTINLSLIFIYDPRFVMTKSWNNKNFEIELKLNVFLRFDRSSRIIKCQKFENFLMICLISRVFCLISEGFVLGHPLSSSIKSLFTLKLPWIHPNLLIFPKIRY